MRGRIALQERFVQNMLARLASFRGSLGSAHASPRRFRLSVQRPRGHTTRLISIVATSLCLTSCASVSQHQFSDPAAGWQTKTGQLMYRTAKATLIGESIVRFSKSGDFELTVSKGPGITLLSLRQDAAFAEINASFTGQHWSGPTASAPSQLRGWLGLRDQFLRAPNQKTLRYATGSETFLFRF